MLTNKFIVLIKIIDDDVWYDLGPCKKVVDDWKAGEPKIEDEKKVDRVFKTQLKEGSFIKKYHGQYH